MNASLASCQKLNLDGLVIIGGKFNREYYLVTDMVHIAWICSLCFFLLWRCHIQYWCGSACRDICRKEMFNKGAWCFSFIPFTSIFLSPSVQHFFCSGLGSLPARAVVNALYLSGRNPATKSFLHLLLESRVLYFVQKKITEHWYQLLFPGCWCTSNILWGFEEPVRWS